MQFYEIADRLQGLKEHCVIATLLHVEGSSYLKEGAMLLFHQDGKTGMISAGCVESDLEERSRQVLLDGQPQYAVYNQKSDEDLLWGTGSGCSGVLYVLVERVDENLRGQLLDVKRSLEEGKTVLHRKECLSDGRRLIIKNFFNKEMKKETIIKNGLIKTNGEHMVFSYRFESKRRLVIFGAGEDAKAVAKLASETGWSVTVCDCRSALCNHDEFPFADHLIVGFPSELFDKLALNSEDFAVIMSHNFQQDKEFLSLILKENLRYVGVLGPRNRTEGLLETKQIPAFLFSPIGLPIGSSGPHEIAVSILAELISVYRLEKRSEGSIL
ncbi:XdhC family protein [Fictibacillus sp. NRS-1165]|uniref:XdhC family protein n=1 Tax=Fictibacillus sp. NRS-1165 TaxID=3144463 RepID=UPI003D1C57B3